MPSDTAALEAEIARLKAAFALLEQYAESQYFAQRAKLDQIPGWTHGDDYPVYPLIRISQFAKIAAGRMPVPGGANPDQEKSK